MFKRFKYKIVYEYNLKVNVKDVFLNTNYHEDNIILFLENSIGSRKIKKAGNYLNSSILLKAKLWSRHIIDLDSIRSLK